MGDPLTPLWINEMGRELRREAVRAAIVSAAVVTATGMAGRRGVVAATGITGGGVWLKL